MSGCKHSIRKEVIISFPVGWGNPLQERTKAPMCLSSQFQETKWPERTEGESALRKHHFHSPPCDRVPMCQRTASSLPSFLHSILLSYAYLLSSSPQQQVIFLHLPSDARNGGIIQAPGRVNWQREPLLCRITEDKKAIWKLRNPNNIGRATLGS